MAQRRACAGATMMVGEPFTIVIPTRDRPDCCRQSLEALLAEIRQTPLALRIVFLANDTDQGSTGQLRTIAAEPRFAALEPIVITAAGNHLTAEENIRHTLGDNLDQVGEQFLIIGNTDLVRVEALRDAAAYFARHQLDLLLIGVVNREVLDGRAIRQFYTMPRHLNPWNRLGPRNCYGHDIFSCAFSDYGPVDALAFIGCQIYSKRFFRELCRVEAALPDPLYSHSLGSLEVSTRTPWSIGYFPEEVVVRVDDLADSAHSPGRYKLQKGLSSHVLLSVLTNSLHVSAKAFSTLVTAHMVSISRGCPQYYYSNFLFTLVHQLSSHVMHSSRDLTLRYCAGELQDIVSFGQRMEGVDIGLPPAHSSSICQWLQHFGKIGAYTEPARIDTLLAGSSPVLAFLDRRPGMERWWVKLA